MIIKILGPGCANCKKLVYDTRVAVSELGLEAEIEYITDLAEINKYVMLTPGLVIDGELAHQGTPQLDINKIKKIIQAKLG